MIRCAAVRKKGSEDQCAAHAVVGHSLCGRHARAKQVRLWADVHKNVDIVSIQALIRGWLVRRRLALAGPGVLCRKDVANTEDLVTCEERIHPFEYFAFTENGKTWWFDFGTIWVWCQRSHQPVNPYTKVALDTDTRKRLRAMWVYRRNHKMFIPAESLVYEERLRGRWNIMCQAFEDYGFTDVHPNQFMRLNKGNYATAFRFLQADLEVSMRMTHPLFDRFMSWCFRGMLNAPRLTTHQFILQSSYVFMLMTCFPKDPYITLFTLLSALYRC